MVKKKTKKLWSKLLFVIGISAVVVPHLWFLVDTTQNLNTLGHAWTEVIAAIFLTWGYLIRK